MAIGEAGHDETGARQDGDQEQPEQPRMHGAIERPQFPLARHICLLARVYMRVV